MKERKFFIFFGFFALFLLSCAKEKTAVNFSQDQLLLKGNELFSKIEKIEGVENRKLAYSNLSNAERYSVWNGKLEKLLNSNKFTKEQKIRISALKDKLSIGLFNPGDDREVFKSIWLPEWIRNSKPYFNEIQIYNIAFTLDDEIIPSINNELQTSGSESGDNMCFCAVYSNFTCLYSYFGNPAFGTCHKLATSCITKVRGCGALWDDDCDGNFCTT